MRRTLALLLSRAGLPVQADFIIETVWFGHPPPTARRTLSSYISRLRQLLGDDGRVESGSNAYTLRLRDSELDALTFERLAAQAVAEREAGRSDLARSTLTSALAIWRGPAYCGLLDMEPVATAAARLEELRLGLFEDRVQLDLDGGRHGEVIAELAQMITGHPYREQLRGQHMLALYRSGRQAEALDAYRATYQQLNTDLGVAPGIDLQRLQQRILAADPSLTGGGSSSSPADQVPQAAAASPPRPALLPLDQSGFAGRAAQLAVLDELLDTESASASPVALVSGTAGVGKTALVVRWAHQARERFPDGQLYADLRGYSPGAPAQPLEVLGRFLRACGTPADSVPPGTDDAVAAYRSVLADRRVLIVLDNASSAEQVRPLLPGGAACAVVVTSRDRLDGLIAKDGARRLDLAVLGQDEAADLLAAVIGSEPVGAEPDQLEELASLCGYLPLALRIAAATILSEHSCRIGAYVTRLRSGDRLTTLSIDGDPGSAVRGAFDSSYHLLDSAARRLFRLLSLLPGSDITVAGAAALADFSQVTAAGVVRRLVAAHLLEERDCGRFAVHDLLRLYAAERARADESADSRAEATVRLMTWYLTNASAASRRFHSIDEDLAPDARAAGFSSDQDAISWLDAERGNLVAAVVRAADDGLIPLAWKLPTALRGYFLRTKHTADWLETARAGLAAAKADGDPLALARTWHNLGTVTFSQSKYNEAASHYHAAYESAVCAGWLRGQKSSLTNLGCVRIATGELAEAESYLRRAVAIERQGARWRPASELMTNLGIIAHQSGQLQRAEQYQRAALRTARRGGDATAEAIALQYLGFTTHALGDLDGSLSQLTRAHDLHRSAGSRTGLGHTLMDIASVHLDAGRFDRAAEMVEAALVIVRATGDRQSEALVMNIRGRLSWRISGPGNAGPDHLAALELARRLGTRYAEAESLTGLAHIWATSRPREARGYADAALAIADRAGFRLLSGLARTAKAVALASCGGEHAAIATTLAESAVALHRKTGHRLGEATALAVVSRLTAADCDRSEASERAARSIVQSCGAPTTVLLWPGTIAAGSPR
ncbi:MAG TPA: BTAD domain-containing putative transcriptional regulator [Streptosporangiaceae bacterium]|nr:BTAD domain-containing putative transcriptional regulator [Streptosporangiaceae bacterium]